MNVLKKTLRQELRHKLAAVSPEQLQQRSTVACRLLCEQEEYQRANIVMIFLSTVHEIDTRQHPATGA